MPSKTRTVNINIRVSPEEERQINTEIALSGMLKREYILSRLTNREIVVRGNCKIHRAVYDALTDLVNQLQRIESAGEVNEALIQEIDYIVKYVQKLYV